MLHTHLPYDGLTHELGIATPRAAELCRELQGRRELRREWLRIVSALLGADRGGVHEEDLVVVEQMCVEWSDALQVTELLELLTILLYSHPASVYPGRTRSLTPFYYHFNNYIIILSSILNVPCSTCLSFNRVTFLAVFTNHISPIPRSARSKCW
jgi:hypothetical protein